MTKITVIYSGNEKAVFTKVISSSLSNSLSGECTFEFSVTSAMAMDISTGQEVILSVDGIEYCFNIVRVSKFISDGLTICTITCEHKSYELNNPEYNISEFNFSGDPTECLNLLLEGTRLTGGGCEPTVPVELKINQECTRRAALMQLVALCGGEIAYQGNEIKILSHRGSGDYLEIMDGKNITDLTVDIDKRSNTYSYGLTLYKKLDFGVGDNVHIVFTPFYLDVFTRIISMSYNPFYRNTISIEVGDYIPSISDDLYRLEKASNQVREDISESTAEIKTGVNMDEIYVGTLSQELFRITYNALKATYAAFIATVKFTVSVAGTLVFLLKKDESEIMRYTEQYDEGDYARTYSYPFVSEAAKNSITLSVITTDGAEASLPKMQSWGYVMGAYLAGDNPWDGYIRFREAVTAFLKTNQKREKHIGNIKDTLIADFPIMHTILHRQLVPEFIKGYRNEKALSDGISIGFPTSWNPVITTPPPLVAVNTSNRELYVEMRNPVRADGEIVADSFTMIITNGIVTTEVKPIAVYLDGIQQLDSDVIGSKLRLLFNTSIMKESTQSITILYDGVKGNLWDAFNNVMVENFQTSFIYIPYEEEEENNGT